MYGITNSLPVLLMVTACPLCADWFDYILVVGGIVGGRMCFLGGSSVFDRWKSI
jgi:hypothetical protein